MRRSFDSADAPLRMTALFPPGTHSTTSAPFFSAENAPFWRKIAFAVVNFQENAPDCFRHLVKTHIKTAIFLYILTLPKCGKMWYVMHGVLWAHCAHGTHRFFGELKAGVFFVIRSVSAGGYSRVSKEAAGVDPVGGSPTNSKKRIKSKEL